MSSSLIGGTVEHTALNTRKCDPEYVVYYPAILTKNSVMNNNKAL